MLTGRLMKVAKTLGWMHQGSQLVGAIRDDLLRDLRRESVRV